MFGGARRKRNAAPATLAFSTIFPPLDTYGIHDWYRGEKLLDSPSHKIHGCTHRRVSVGGKMSDGPQIGDVRTARCPNCAGKRNCDIKGVVREHEEDDENPYWWSRVWYLLQCRGCDTPFVQTISSNSEDYNYDNEGRPSPDYTVKYWPAPAKRKRPEWFDDVFGLSGSKSTDLDEALVEVYKALDNDLRMLAGIGIRTAFDKASEELGVETSHPFVKKLDNLVDGGHIGAVDRDRLSVLVDAGSASAHRGWKPKIETLNTMMDILEHFLYRTFVEPERSRRLDESTQKIKISVPKKNSNSDKKKNDADTKDNAII